MSKAALFSETLVRAAERADRALVHVAASCRRGATGSLYDPDGVVVTTARAVAGQSRVEVAQGEQTVQAVVVGFDWATDVGVLRLESPLGEAPEWATTPLALGTAVLGASRPGRTTRVRLGIVSQVGPAFHTPRGGRVARYVETDLTPEPGFSGGLGFDLEGRALGMSSAGILRGVPLLLEKPTLDRIVGALLSHGRVQRGYLGVGSQAVRLPPALAVSSGQSFGLLVSSVQPDSAAERAGIALGDVLLALGPTQLSGVSVLQAALEDTEGQTLPLRLLRASQALSVDVTLGARP